MSLDMADGLWPVYGGRAFNLWTPDTGAYFAWAEPGRIFDWLQSTRLGKRSPQREFPLRHLQDPATLPVFKPRIAFRDVARATDGRTLIACLVPPNVFLTNKAPYFLWPQGDELDQAFLLGVLCSIPLDWYARRYVELSVNYYVLNPFPVPRPSRDDLRWQRVVEVAGRLASPDDRFAEWAGSVGVVCGPLDEDDKNDKIHELDALVAHLYGLSEAQLVHIFDTFHVETKPKDRWDQEGRLRAVLQHFHAWAKKG